MIRREDCAFQDGSYPCGYKDGDKLPDCELCHKIRKAVEEERLDRPELREEIAVALFNEFAPTVHNHWQSVLPEIKKGWLERAAQILAIKPTEEEIRRAVAEEIKKQEIGRIINLMDEALEEFDDHIRVGNFVALLQHLRRQALTAPTSGIEEEKE